MYCFLIDQAEGNTNNENKPTKNENTATPGRPIDNALRPIPFDLYYPIYADGIAIYVAAVARFALLGIATIATPSASLGVGNLSLASHIWLF